MHTPLSLLKFVAKALGNAVGFGVAGDLVVDVLPEVARDVWQWWGTDRTAEQRRAEVEAVAQAGAEEVRLQASEIVLELIADKPPKVQQDVETYLTQVPAAIRRSLRRPSDPTGTTVPADLAPAKADDLLRLLPRKRSPFRPGDHPPFKPDWELEQLLGVGGFGEVWKARNPNLSKRPPVALKFCLDPAAAKVLRNEAAVLERVMCEGKHPGIVQLLDTHLLADTPCLEYEYVAGGELTGWIQEWHRKAGPSPRQAAQVILSLARIVGYAHRLSPPIVHRDLKPANILLERTAEGKAQCKIADFGIGGVAVGQAIRETTRGTSQGSFLSSTVHGSYTPLYASPQQMRGEAPDPRDDVYSLGVIWYQLLTGNLAGGAPSGSRWRKNLAEQGVSAEMADLMESCFEDRSDDRPKDAAALAERLATLLTPADTTPRETSQEPEKMPPATAKPDLGEMSHRGIRGTTEVERAERKKGAKKKQPKKKTASPKKGNYDQEIDKVAQEISALTEAIRINPQDANLYGERAEALLDQGDYDRAVADCSEAIRINPHDSYLYELRAEAFSEKGEYDWALADCSEGIRLDPSASEFFYMRGETYLKKGDFDRAITDYTEAIRPDPKRRACPDYFRWATALAYVRRGLAHQRNGDVASALNDFSEALRLDPKCVAAEEARDELQDRTRGKRRRK
jgi:serine/threonine protein kinase/Tfp pilus assembly protein PilF